LQPDVNINNIIAKPIHQALPDMAPPPLFAHFMPTVLEKARAG